MPTAAETSRFGSFSRKVETAANIATIVVAVLLSVVLVKNYLLPTSSQRLLQGQSSSIRPANLAGVGTNLGKQLSGVNWNRNGRTIVLALSTHCHFCTESAPFFRQIRERVGKSVTLIGVLPETTAEAESYLHREDVQLDEIRQISLDKIGVRGTPTLLLVNENGIVTQTWVGKLAPDKQGQVLKIISAVHVQKGGSKL